MKPDFEFGVLVHALSDCIRLGMRSIRAVWLAAGNRFWNFLLNSEPEPFYHLHASGIAAPLGAKGADVY